MKDDLVESLLVHDVDEPLPADHERRIRAGLGALLGAPGAAPAPAPKVDAPPPRAPLADVAAPGILGKLPMIGLLVLGAAGAGFVAGRATAPVAAPSAAALAPASTTGSGAAAISATASTSSAPLEAPASALTPPIATSPTVATGTSTTARPIAPPTPSSDPFDREQSLLERARAALVRHDAAGAGAALDECERQFPHPSHAEERDYLRIQALRELGDTARARARAQAFLAKYPTSLYRARVEPLLE